MDRSGEREVASHFHPNVRYGLWYYRQYSIFTSYKTLGTCSVDAVNCQCHAFDKEAHLGLGEAIRTRLNQELYLKYALRFWCYALTASLQVHIMA